MTKLSRSFNILVWLLYCINGNTQDCSVLRSQDSLHLLNFYNSLTDKGLLNWDFSKPLHEIEPTKIKLADGCRISYLELNNRNLNLVAFPKEILQLNKLNQLHLVNCKIEGNIPEELFSLAELQVLDLGTNLLSGTLPKNLDRLRKLKTLNLYENQFTGSIPDELYNLTNLQILNIRGNKLSGTISPQIKNLKELEHLRLFSNQFTGNIPNEIGECINLKTIAIQNNFFIELPSTLANLSQLNYVYLDNNLFENIPLLQNPNLITFSILNNKLTIEDILPQYRLIDNKRTEFKYNVQDTINEFKEVKLHPKEKYILQSTVDQSISTNRRIWVKKDEEHPVSTNHSYELEYNNLVDKDQYYCLIANPELPGLKLIVKDDLLSGKAQVNEYRDTLCEGYSEVVEDVRFDESHPKDSIFLYGRGVQGHDSIMVVKFFFKPNSKYEISAKFCSGSTFELNGQYYNRPSTYKQNYKNSIGCDSVIVLYLDYYDVMLSEPKYSKDNSNPNLFNIDPNIYNNSTNKTYAWSNGSKEPILSKVAMGIYKLSVTDGNGCEKVFSYDIQKSVVGLEESELASQIKISPNPSSKDEYFEIQMNTNEVLDNDFTYSLFSLDGRKFRENQALDFTQNKAIISTIGLFPSTFILRIENSKKGFKVNKRITIL